VVQVGIGVLDAGDLLAGDRMGRHEAADLLAQRAPGRIDDVALGRADVHDQHAAGDQVLDRLERGFGEATGTASSTMSAPETASRAEAPRRR
jgi:hypothetical protein